MGIGDEAVAQFGETACLMAGGAEGGLDVLHPVGDVAAFADYQDFAGGRVHVFNEKPELSGAHDRHTASSRA